MDFEKKLERMEELVEKMENSETSLEDSIAFFEEGIRLSKECHKQLSEAEQKVKVLLSVDESGAAQTDDFQVNAGE